MAHISSISPAMYSDLSVSFTASAAAAIATAQSLPVTRTAITDFDAYFASEKDGGATVSGLTAPTKYFSRIKNVREFPSIGTPANIVNVPAYGQRTSLQVQGQADAPSMEITLNFVAADWAAGTYLRTMVNDGNTHMFRFALMNGEPAGYISGAATGLGDATSGGSNTNSQWYFLGKLEALLVNPQLTDAVTATLTVTVLSDFYGAFTQDA